jgi:hypothetical protein
VGPRGGLDAVAKRKIPSLPLPLIDHDRQAYGLITILTELPRVQLQNVLGGFLHPLKLKEPSPCLIRYGYLVTQGNSTCLRVSHVSTECTTKP